MSHSAAKNPLSAKISPGPLAIQRMAHLVLGLHHPMDRASLVDEGRFDIALTQVHFAEMLGLSFNSRSSIN